MPKFSIHGYYDENANWVEYDPLTKEGKLINARLSMRDAILYLECSDAVPGQVFEEYLTDRITGITYHAKMWVEEAKNDLSKPGEEKAHKNTSPQEGSSRKTITSTDGQSAITGV